MTYFHIGCDPEVFLIDAAGALVSAIGKIGGSKQFPRPLPIGSGFAVQEDNVALEFNTPPAATEQMFVDNVERVSQFLLKEVNSMGLAFSKASAAQFPEKELLDPMAQEFGCDPDYNAWTFKKNPRPVATDKQLRSCGGHVHIGYDFPTAKSKAMFIRYMDLFTAVPSVLMDNGELRKQLYGKAGAFRVKSYGVEYRTLSNYWIFDNELVRWVYKATQSALTAWDKQTIDIDEWGPNIQEAINSNNKELAMSLVDHFGLELHA